MINVEVKILNDKVSKLPCYASEGAAGMDLYAIIDEETTIEAGEIVKIPTGIAIAIPDAQTVGLVYPRSGLSTKHGISLANCVGVIDSDYRGEILCAMINNSKTPYTINPMDRIAQLVFMPVHKAVLKEVAELDKTDRDGKGFGSSGR